MFQLHATNPADALVSVQDAELKVTRVGSGVMTKLTSVDGDEAGTAGLSAHEARISIAHMVTTGRRHIVMLDSVEWVDMELRAE